MEACRFVSLIEHNEVGSVLTQSMAHEERVKTGPQAVWAQKLVETERSLVLTWQTQ